jgi:hypothetical protein
MERLVGNAAPGNSVSATMQRHSLEVRLDKDAGPTGTGSLVAHHPTRCSNQPVF